MYHNIALTFKIRGIFQHKITSENLVDKIKFRFGLEASLTDQGVKRETDLTSDKLKWPKNLDSFYQM